jgi:hypothetical protein
MARALPKESREGVQPCCIDQQEEETAMATDEELREQALKAIKRKRDFKAHLVAYGRHADAISETEIQREMDKRR